MLKLEISLMARSTEALLAQVAKEPNEETLAELCMRVFNDPATEKSVLSKGQFDALKLQLRQGFPETYCAKIHFLAGMKAHLNKDFETAQAEFVLADQYGCPHGTYWLAIYLACGEGTYSLEKYLDGEAGAGTRTNQPEAIKKFQAIATVIPDANYYLIHFYKKDENLRTQKEALEQFTQQVTNASSKDVIELLLHAELYTNSQLTQRRPEHEINKLTAFFYAQKAAMVGSPSGMYHLGLCYLHGDGVQKNQQQAIQWLEKAATEKQTPAMLLAGKLYEEGTAVTQDLVKAGHFYKMAAEAQDATGYYEYARFLKAGLGNVRKDADEARKYCKLAADKKISAAQYLYATMCEEEMRQEDVVVQAYHEAADNGSVPAMLKLGVHFFSVYKKHVAANSYNTSIFDYANTAYYWLKIATDKGCLESMYHLCCMCQSKYRNYNDIYGLQHTISWTALTAFTDYSLFVLRKTADPTLARNMLDLILNVRLEMKQESWKIRDSWNSTWTAEKVAEQQYHLHRFATRINWVGILNFIATNRNPGIPTNYEIETLISNCCHFDAKTLGNLTSEALIFLGNKFTVYIQAQLAHVMSDADNTQLDVPISCFNAIVSALEKRQQNSPDTKKLREQCHDLSTQLYTITNNVEKALPLLLKRPGQQCYLGLAHLLFRADDFVVLCLNNWKKRYLVIAHLLLLSGPQDADDKRLLAQVASCLKTNSPAGISSEVIPELQNLPRPYYHATRKFLKEKANIDLPDILHAEALACVQQVPNEIWTNNEQFRYSIEQIIATIGLPSASIDPSRLNLLNSFLVEISADDYTEKLPLRRLEHHYFQCDKLIVHIAETNQPSLMRLIVCLQPHVNEMIKCSKDSKQKETADTLCEELQPWVHHSLALIKALQGNNNDLLQAAKNALKELLKPYSLFERATTKLSMLFKSEQRKPLLHRDSALLESLLIVAEIEIAATQAELVKMNK